MKRCRFEQQIDSYLLGKLSEPESKEFEIHYFNCSRCFEQMKERDEVIQAVKREGAAILSARYSEVRATKPRWFQRIFSIPVPQRWAVATAAAALVLIAVFVVVPLMRKTSPQFSLERGENIVRGSSLALLSPHNEVREMPAQFVWQKLEKEADYQFSLYGEKLLWTASTGDNMISLPEAIAAQIQAGQTYAWQVKAFTPQGALIATSEKVQFKVALIE